MSGGSLGFIKFLARSARARRFMNNIHRAWVDLGFHVGCVCLRERWRTEEAFRGRLGTVFTLFLEYCKTS